MPNSFESEFSKIPYLKGELQKIEDSKEAQQHADEQRAIAAAKNEARKKNIQEEIEKYHAMVADVLEELRDTLYPELKVISGDRNKASISDFWQLCPPMHYALRYYSASEGSTRGLYPIISIGLSVADTGEAKGFVCEYREPGHDKTVAPVRIREAKLTRQSLIKALVEIHTPNPRLQEIAERDAEVRKVLELYLDSPTLNQIGMQLVRKEEARRTVQEEFKRNKSKLLSAESTSVVAKSKEYPLRDVVPSSFQYDDAWVIRCTAGVEAYSEGMDSIKLEWRAVTQYLVGVKIIFNENGTATHYGCRSYFTRSGTRVEGGVDVQLAELDEVSLASVIQKMIDKIPVA